VTATADGCRLWTDASGDGPPLVLCHGGPGLWDMFADLRGLPARTIRWDQRGCGRSDRRGPYTVARSVADLDAVRRQVAGDRTALLGHSLGATLALRYALAHPENVSALIYVSGTGIDPDAAWKPVYRTNLRDRLADGGHLARWEELDRADRDAPDDREWATLQWTADFADRGRALDLAGRMATPWFPINYDCNAGLGADTRRDAVATAERCRALDVPTLIVHGADDIRPAWAVDSLHDALPNSRRVILPDVGHVPWLEAPDDFRAVVAEFLR
jgi:proline iminopeptidase